MSRNTAIKKYRMHTRGQAIDLFATGIDSPVVAELLSAPWIRRASELVDAKDGAEATRGGSGKLAEEPVEVAWDGERACPTSFRRSGTRRSYQVEALVGYWVEERFWWDESAHVSRRCFRVVAHSGAIYDSDKMLTVAGKVREFQWTNPHCWVQVTVAAAGGDEEWPPSAFAVTTSVA